MLKKLIIITIISHLIIASTLAFTAKEQAYVNKLKYTHNKLELLSKKRLIDEKRSYSYTDIDTTTLSIEAYSSISTDISTSSLSQSETLEINEWYIYKGGLRELTDLEFVALVGDYDKQVRIQGQENNKARLRGLGNLSIGAGLIAMIGAAATSTQQSIVTAGALVMTTGFFLKALNNSPKHYIKPDYAQEKISEYNIKLKQNLNLPLDFD